MFKRSLSIFTFTGILIVTIGALGTHNANADERHGRSIAGSYIVNGESAVVGPFTNLTTLSKDGTVINSDPEFGTGHGAWKRIGRREYSFKFIVLIPPDTDFPAGTVQTVTGTLEPGHGGASFSGPFLTVFELPGVGELFRFEGIVELEQITIDDDNDDSDSDRDSD